MKGSRTNYYSGFTPSSIPGCALWLDATDSNSMTLTGTTITQWKDKSGNANHTSGGSGTVSLLSNAINGLPAASFSNTYFTGGFSTAFTGTQLHCFAVATMNSATTSYGRILSLGRPGVNDYNDQTTTFPFIRDNGQARVMIGRNGSYLGVNLVAYNAPFLVQSGHNGSTEFIGLNGTTAPSTQNTGVTSAFNITSYGLGASTNTGDTGSYWYGYIGEVLYYSNQLSIGQRQAVEGYLARKWGLAQSLNTLLIATHPYQFAAPAGFAPTDISGCAVWLDGADSNSMTLSGSNVSQWNDKSGNARHFSQASSARYPVYTSNAINGRSSISFTGTGSSTQVLDNATLPISNTAYSVFCVARGNASQPSSTGYNYILKGNITGDFFLFFGNHSSKNFATFAGTSSGWNDIASNSPAISVTSTTLLMGMVISGSVLTPYYNGNTMTTKTGTTGSYSGMRIGDAPPGNEGQGWNGLISEILIFNVALTTTQRQQVEGYLAWKWGSRATVFASSNTYASLPPVIRPFVPTDISGCALWLDPTDATTVTRTGSTVTAWNDKSGNGNNMTTQNGNPVYSTALINGLPGMDLTNNSGFISAANSTLTSSLTLAMVLVVKSGIQNWGSFFTHGGRDFDFALERNSINAGTSLLHFQTANDNTNGDIAYTIDQVALYSGTMTAGTSRYFQRIGGGTSTSATATNSSSITTGSQTIRIGRSDGGEACSSHIGEIVYYNAALTTAQREQLETYLVNKWGLRTSAPVGHYARLSPALSMSFLPITVESCSLWLDAADPTTFTLSGSNISQWSDKSGNARHATQATSGLQPTWSNGVVVLPGGRYLNMSNAFSMLATTTTQHHLWVVERRGSNVGTHYMLGFGGSGGTGIAFGYNDNTTFNYTSAIVADTQYTVPGWQSTDPIRIWGGVYNGTTRQLFLNGTRVTTTNYSTAATAWSNASIGYLPLANINSTYIGNIYEILVYGSPLTVSQRQVIEGYLATKWGLRSSLPSTHPYRLVKP